MTGDSGDEGTQSLASIVDALLVYAEPLASGAYAVVVGDAASPVAERLLDLGARNVTVFDPDPVRASRAARLAPRGVSVRSMVEDLEVRDGSFDLAVIPDLSELGDPRGAVARLRRAVAADGAVVTMARAVTEGAPPPFAGALGPAALAYGELYDLFASQFEDVSLAGVLPFTGVVFAELGTDEDPAVSVDTRLVAPAAPSVFVIVARQRAAREGELDPYAIVQVDERPAPVERESRLALEAVVAASQLKVELLGTQLEELKDRLVVSDVRAVETAARLDRANQERDVALTRAMELEAILAAAQQSLAVLERRLLEAERGMLDRDDRIAQLSAELDARASARPDMNELLVRAERAEAALAIAHEELSQRLTLGAGGDAGESAALAARSERLEEELTQLLEAHAAEAATYEAQLQGRARHVAALEKELVRREQMVRELVATALERESAAHAYEAAPPLPARAPAPAPPTGPDPRVAVLERKLDELAGEIARREGELTARGWRIQELENTLRRRSVSADAPGEAAGSVSARPPSLADAGKLEDELFALRQALAQEHAARVAAESGEELTRVRAELAQKVALLEQVRAQRGTS